ncbi:MAG: DUF2007 domain-containing protein [Bacteroidales bacterium]|nr:DUF2007 domain-containing protein [Bacteroidales bacterium]
MKTVKYYPSVMDAQMDRSLLEAEGIRCNILNENMPYAGYFAGGNFDIELVVADEDYDQACAILAAKECDIPEETLAEESAKAGEE